MIAAGIWAFLTVRNIVRAFTDGNVVVSWFANFWWMRPWTVYRNDDALGFWIVVFAKGLFAMFMIAIAVMAILGALAPNSFYTGSTQ